jgi:hypothetical protein
MRARRRIYRFLIPVLILASAGFAFAGWCPSADLNGNCWVNIYDLEILAEQWLNSQLCEEMDYCADYDGFNNVDFADFAFLASQWQTHGSMLFINEFMSSNTSASGIHDEYNDYDDWIEIYNIGDSPIDMAGMYLTDDLANPTKWQIPSGSPSQTTIPANGYLVFWADEETSEGPRHTNFKLSAGGEEIGLIDTNGITVLDEIAFGEQATNISYGRYPSGEQNWRFFPIPTPGADNNNVAYLGEIEKVEFSKERGFYDANFTLTLACVSPGVNIYYTTNGKSPIAGEVNVPGSIRYTTPFNINSSKAIRAAAIKTGWMPSPVETHTYIFGANSAIKAMPAVSLVGDSGESLYEPNGIMAIVGGQYVSDPGGGYVWVSGGDPNAYNNPMHRGIAYERPVSFEIFNSSSDGNYQENCGIRVHGSDYTRPRYTRGDDWLCNSNKFSFNLFFRSAYGDNRFEYPFFPFTPEVDRFQSIALRGGHNDLCSPFVKDEWTRRLFKEMGNVQVTGTFVNVYINGSYKYYYNPIAREDEEFFQEWYNSDNDFDVITNTGVRDGDSTEWNNLVNYANSNDLSNASNYNYFAGKFDIVTFIDYLILEIHSGNFDWPGNNWTVHHERSDSGIFRFSIWDADGVAESWIFGNNCEYCDKTAFEDFPTWTSPTGLNHISWDATSIIYRALKTNPDFRQLFADRIHKHYHNGGIMTPAHLTEKWWEVQAEVANVLPWQSSYVPDVFLPAREPYVLAAFETNGLFNRAFGAPVFYVNGGYKFGGYVSTSDTFTITDPCSSGGTIYYTTDGSDPRQPASGLSFVIDNASKKVLIPSGDIGTTWRGGSEPYNDSAWTSGAGGVGYERDTGYESYIGIDVESAMYSNNGICYIRIPFNIDACDIGHITALTLQMRYDDGFIAYINGTEVLRVNAPTTPAWNSTASTGHEASAEFDSYNISAYISSLHSGTNILAIHGLNASTGSSDFLISAELTGMATGGNISSSAIPYTGSFTLNKSTNLRSRIYKSSTDEWSPLNEAVYEVGNALGKVGDFLRITEIMYNPADTCEPNDENTEYIELRKRGPGTINLNLVKFDKGIDFTFGPNTLSGNQHILVVKDINAFETKYGTGYYIAGQYTGSLDNGGERIRLLDAVGTTILDFNYKDGWRSIADGDGYSLTIINPTNIDVNSWKYKESWRASAYVNGSPGWDDSGIIPNPGDIVINEVMSHSHAGAPDWIELYNTTASSIDIGGWYLSDSDSNVMKYRFATGTSIPANGYLVVSEDVNFGEAATDPGKLIPFALSENGEVVILTSALDANSMLTGYREKEDFGASETGVSFGRYYKSSTDSYNFVPMDHNTPGAANAYPKVGPIVITEIMYHPDWPTGGNYVNDEYEYIELRNTSGASVTLYDSVENAPWKFTSGIDYTFPSPPSAVTIPAGGRILVVKNPTAFNWRYPGLSSITYGPYNGWLANDGEQLELGKPGDLDELAQRQYIRVERVNYSDGSHPGDEPDQWPINADGLGKSLTRTSQSLYGNDPNNWTAATPTPGT